MRRRPTQLRDATGAGLWLRQLNVARLTAARLARWLVEDDFATPARVAPAGPIAHSVRMAIARGGAHPALEAGKRHNVRLAATAFHGAVITPDRPLSFWRTLGPATAARGFTWGMELRGGCAVPAIGGGLCLLSNALFTLAVEQGWRIVERHGHSMALGDRDALDATVAFPYIDLRTAPRDGTAVLDVAVRGDVLVVAVRHDAPALRVELSRTQREAPVAATDAAAAHDAHAADAAGAARAHDDAARAHDDASRVHDDLRVVATRETRIWRRVWRGDALLEQALIVDDHQRVPGALRTCLDCGETACTARITIPDRPGGK